MKVVVNRPFGGFHFGKGYCEEYGIDSSWAYDGNSTRTSPQLVEWVENHPDDNPDLEVVYVPACATDWQIHEYDGAEEIIAVIDGKIEWL